MTFETPFTHCIIRNTNKWLLISQYEKINIFQPVIRKNDLNSTSHSYGFNRVAPSSSLSAYQKLKSNVEGESIFQLVHIIVLFLLLVARWRDHIQKVEICNYLNIN